MSKVSISISCVVLIFVTSGAMATPVWRTSPPGQPPTTYQQWTFCDADNPALPEFFNNQYGTPEARLKTTGDPDYFGWLSVVNDRQGIWAGEPLNVELTIPNQQAPNKYKEIWLEMDFTSTLRWVTVTPVPLYGSVVEEICRDISQVDQWWQKLVIGWRIEPNPSEETICISIMGTGGFVDFITVDTICVPEPATLTLLGMGTLVLVKRKRK